MNDHTGLKNEVQQQVRILEEVVGELRDQGIAKVSAPRWLDHLAVVKGAFRDPVLRMAVVGSVKSGKSTLVNTLLGKDLLKRGAGIITAFITRVRTDGEAGGWVELKAWSQVLKEINESLRMLPTFREALNPDEPLDIRRDDDRKRLESILENARTEWQHDKGRVDSEFLLLNSYLRGYLLVHDKLGEEVVRLAFDADSIQQHQHYVGHEGQAAYLRDLELHYPARLLDEFPDQEIEIADCQGSDSPNPLHFALLQEYLLTSHFVLFVINGRSGLREADFKLLQFIKTLQMVPRTFFVLNLDLGLHSHHQDIERLVDRVRTELEWVAPDPRIYSFSALYHLIDRAEDGASGHERRQLDLWRADEEIVRITVNGFESFRKAVVTEIARKRSRILMECSLDRLTMVAGAVVDTARTQEKLLDANFDLLEESRKQLKSRQKALQNTFGSLENIITGLKSSLKRELDRAVADFFDPAEGPMVKETLDLVEHYPIDPKRRRELADQRRVLQGLYGCYMEFRYALSRHLVDIVNLKVIEFAKEEEAFLQERLKESYDTFVSFYATARENYRREMARLEIKLSPATDFTGWESLFDGEVSPPTFSTFVDHEAIGRGVLLLKFGLGRLAHFLTNLKSSIGKRGDLPGWRTGEIDAVDDALRLVKSEAKYELMFAFRDYAKSFRSAYLHKLLEEGVLRLSERFKSLNETAQLELADFLKHSRIEEEKRRPLVEALAKAEKAGSAVVDALAELRDKSANLII